MVLKNKSHIDDKTNNNKIERNEKKEKPTTLAQTTSQIDEWAVPMQSPMMMPM